MKSFLLILTLACSSLGYAKPLNSRDDIKHNGPLAPRVTNAASPTSSCTTTLVTPAPAGLRCEQTGVVARPATLVPASTVPKSVATPFVACRNACLANTKCVGFSYAPGSRSCQEYSKTFDGMGFKQSTEKGSVKVANRHCYKRTCTAPSPVACIPTPSPLLTNPSFETVSTDGSAPPWQTQGSITFVSDSTIATDGSYYADITAPGRSTSVLTQALSGLTEGQNYVLNVTYNVLQPPSSSAGCYLIAAMAKNLNYLSVTSATNGNFLASVQAVTATDAFSITLDCSGSDSGAEVAIDNVRLVLPDPSCLMTIQAVDPSNASGVNGQYLVNGASSSDGSLMFFNADSAQATQYSLDQYGNVYFTSGLYSSYAYWSQDTHATPSEDGYQAIHVYPLTYIDDYVNQVPPYFELVTCSIDPVTSLMSCTDFNQTFLGDRANALGLGNHDQSVALGASPIQLKVSYLSNEVNSGS